MRRDEAQFFAAVETGYATAVVSGTESCVYAIFFAIFFDEFPIVAHAVGGKNIHRNAFFVIQFAEIRLDERRSRVHDFGKIERIVGIVFGALDF